MPANSFSYFKLKTLIFSVHTMSQPQWYLLLMLLTPCGNKHCYQPQCTEEKVRSKNFPKIIQHGGIKD